MQHLPNYCLLDASRMDEAIYVAKQLNERHSCLYEGESEKFLNSVAPFLFSHDQGSTFSHWLLDEGKGKSWGILLESSAEPLELYRHLRRFLIVQTEEDRELYFRYYDPRVLNVFLPTCTAEQLNEFFGPIQTFIAEDERGVFTAYRNDNGLLNVETNIHLAESAVMPDPEVRAQHVDDPTEPTEPPASDSSPSDKIRWDFGY